MKPQFDIPWRVIATTILFFITVNNGLATATSNKNQTWNLHPPLNIPLVVSGSFGELRGGHFHSGVDFTTRGTTGIPIFSIDDGYVSRLFVSPIGFGKAIYVNHPNGFTSVYAHCKWFSDRIEKIVTNIQYQNQSFAIDEYFKPGEIRVRRGEIIAYSGNSGTSGGPHLHFEIRETRTQRPLNVHHFNLPVRDEVAPVIRSIRIYPLEPGSTVNGSTEPLSIQVIKSGNRFILQGSPEINAYGTIGIGIETHDHFITSGRVLGVYSIDLNVDGNRWFRSVLDDFAFEKTRFLNSHIDFSHRHRTGRVVQKSFLDENNKLDIYTVTAERGRVQMTPGQNRSFHYVVRDAADQVSELSFTIRGVNSDANLRVSPSNNPIINPRKPWSTTIEGFSVSFPANSFYTPVEAKFAVRANTGLGIGRHFSVLDETIPVHSFFEISLPLPGPEIYRAGLTGARVSSDGTLAHVSGSIRGNKFVIRTRETGTFCLTIDSTPPVIRLVNIPANRDYRGREAISVELRDNFSGIASFRATINGEWMLFEHDPKNNRLTGYFKNLRISSGQQHQLKIVARDHAGNESVLESPFSY